MELDKELETRYRNAYDTRIGQSIIQCKKFTVK